MLCEFCVGGMSVVGKHVVGERLLGVGLEEKKFMEKRLSSHIKF